MGREALRSVDLSFNACNCLYTKALHIQCDIVKQFTVGIRDRQRKEMPNQRTL